MGKHYALYQTRTGNGDGIMKKLLRHNGESLTETLFSVAIVAVVFVMITGAVTAAARVNNRIQNTDSEFRVASGENETVSASVQVTIANPDSPDGNEQNLPTVPVTVYSSDENKYYYYRWDKSQPGDE